MSAPKRDTAKRGKKVKAPALGTVVVLVALAFAQMYLGDEDAESAPDARDAPAVVEARAGRAASGSPDDGAIREDGENGAIEAAFRAQRSDVQVLASGRVRATLRDDNDGSRHQRFILELASGHTVLVAHNIDLAPRAPLERGDLVAINGEYEWNERGGVVHWTHHDPQGRHEGGWIEYRGRRYE
jgi:hypothetical protein